MDVRCRWPAGRRAGALVAVALLACVGCGVVDDGARPAANGALVLYGQFRDGPGSIEHGNPRGCYPLTGLGFPAGVVNRTDTPVHLMSSEDCTGEVFATLLPGERRATEALGSVRVGGP